jgi:hypothetical protein
MSDPREWFMSRPGLLIPVFFLSLSQVHGQLEWNESRVTALGECYTSSQGLSGANSNQAGLAWQEQSTMSVHHSRPFLLEELGISSLSLQLHTGSGGVSASLATAGLPGLRQTSSWICYGLPLHSGISAGVGIHLWNTHIAGASLSHFGASCSLGILFRVNESLWLGAHVMHPFSTALRQPGNPTVMKVSTGFSYSFFNTAIYHSDLHVCPGGSIQWCHGIEMILQGSLRILLGMHNAPYTLSGGISCQFNNLMVCIAYSYCFDTGSTPSASLSYVL